jgi:hypothetical protein
VNREAAVIVSLATAISNCIARAPETFTHDQKETQA